MNSCKADVLHVAVTGINASNNPAPGIGVARSLKEYPGLKVKIIGLAYDAMEPGIYMNWIVDKSFLVPYPSAVGDALFERLLYIKRNYGLDVVLPNLDSELPFYIRYAQRLAEVGIHTFLPDMAQFQMRDKVKLAGIAERSGLKFPAQIVVSSHEALNKAIMQLGLPIMIKGALYKAYRANNYDEAIKYYNKIVAEWGYPIIIQKIVVGDELNVMGVGDGLGNAPGLIAIKKLSVTEMGKIWTGVTVLHKGVLEASNKFIQSTKWRGAFEIECIANREAAYLIEINPRFPAWVYFATGVGVNLPVMLMQRALGKPVEPIADYEAGKLYVRYTGEQVCDMSSFQDIVTNGEC